MPILVGMSGEETAEPSMLLVAQEICDELAVTHPDLDTNPERYAEAMEALLPDPVMWAVIDSLRHFGDFTTRQSDESDEYINQPEKALDALSDALQRARVAATDTTQPAHELVGIVLICVRWLRHLCLLTAEQYKDLKFEEITFEDMYVPAGFRATVRGAQERAHGQPDD